MTYFLLLKIIDDLLQICQHDPILAFALNDVYFDIVLYESYTYLIVADQPPLSYPIPLYCFYEEVGNRVALKHIFGKK